jgi:hypothetical protein
VKSVLGQEALRAPRELLLPSFSSLQHYEFLFFFLFSASSRAAGKEEVQRGGTKIQRNIFSLAPLF